MLELLQTGNIQDLPQMIRIASAKSNVNTKDYIFAQHLLHEKIDLLAHLSANIKILLDKLLAIKI